MPLETVHYMITFMRKSIFNQILFKGNKIEMLQKSEFKMTIVQYFNLATVHGSLVKVYESISLYS